MNFCGTLLHYCTKVWQVQGCFIHVDDQFFGEVVSFSQCPNSFYQLLQFLLLVSGKLLLDWWQAQRQRRSCSTWTSVRYLSDAQRLGWADAICALRWIIFLCIGSCKSLASNPLDHEWFHICSVGQWSFSTSQACYLGDFGLFLPWV